MKPTITIFGLALCGVLLGHAAALHADPGAAQAQDPHADAAGEVDAADAADAAPAGQRKATGRRAPQGVWQFKLDEVRASVGLFGDAPTHSLATDLLLAASAGMRRGPWEFALGARADGHLQDGGDHARLRLDYSENYLRWRDERRRITIGTQTVHWGRVDEISPVDRLSRADLSRLILDQQADRRRAAPAVRVEQFMGDYKFDLVWLPYFDAAVLPHRASAWHPVDTVTGRVLGIGAVPAAVGAQLRDAEQGSGGAGMRLTHTGGGLDYGLSVQRVRPSLPYYQLGAGVLTAVYPYSTVVGGELETQTEGVTWRMELAWSSAVPTTTRLGQLALEHAWSGVVGAEFFPGDAETRVTLQLSGQRIDAAAPILDRDEIYAMTGEIEHPFAQGRWRFDLRFAAGLNERDLYLNPAVTYLGIDRHEFYLSGHAFSGAARTLGGFYRDKDLIELGWRAKF